MIAKTIPAALLERANLQPDDTAITFVDYDRDWAGAAESLTWSQLYRRTLAVARRLASCASPGDRAVILAHQSLDYITAFLGALEAGLIAVPLSVPMGGVTDERVASVMRDAAPAAILTSSSAVGNVAAYLRANPGEPAPPIIEVDLLEPVAQAEVPLAAKSLPDIAYLQYTSGSTSAPKGVVISHENVLVNCEQMNAGFLGNYGSAPPPDATVVSWLPFYHDMGLYLGFLYPILTGCPAVLTSPVAFLQRPARWMQLLANNSRVISAAPNFAFELAARKTSDDDLAGMDLGGVFGILNGAERVHPATLQRFTDRFAAFNIEDKVMRPAYGMAEATVYIASTEAQQSPVIVHFESDKLTAGYAQRCAGDGGTPLISYGVPRSPMVRIADPETCVECAEGMVGEIWVHGDNVGAGYWQHPEASERTFSARLVSASLDTPEGPWLRTGDSGFLSDGELFIIGRLKDLLIVHGRNHSPDDIEATIQEITRGRCVAIAVPDDDGVEALAAIIELRARDEPEDAATQRMGAMRQEVTSAIWKAHGLNVADLVLVSPGSIPLTTSGKVRRAECLQRYSRDEFTRLDAHIVWPEKRVADDPAVAAESGFGPEADWAQRLRALRQQQQDLLVGVVCSQVAAVLGRPGPNDIAPGSTFQDLGFDSVKAIELVGRLKAETGLALQPTLAFDHPTPTALAVHLGQLLGGSAATAPAVASREATDEPIAVVGMACRFPGGVDSAAALWDLVAGGTEAVGEFPADRGWNLADLFDPDPDAVGKTYTRAGAFLTGAAEFDAEFFGISAREAQSMDPQQRILLEVCWEALETARIDPASLVGSETGVFAGAWSQMYGTGGSDGAEGYALTGLSTSVASGRVAYALGLQGPAITIDTACSSSLVATHLACQSLRAGESVLALAGGVTVMTTPAVFTEFARQRGLAPDGRCKAFSGNADGTGWGEGAAVLVLERLGDAHRNGHPILAVIGGSAINQDGASNGLTAPNGPAQQRVIAQAVANAGIGLDQVDVVEAHGTGTTLGDPIEAGALIATYGAARPADQPLWLGSIKSNIGHTQAAAGAAGIIKMVEALNHDHLPPTLNVEQPSPHVDWSADTVRLLTEPVPWPVTDHPRTAAVSSFGISGTNAHLILHEAPAVPTGPARQGGASRAMLWPVSARTPVALCEQADRLHRYLLDRPDLDLTDLAYSLGTTRAQHSHRAVITAPAVTAHADLLDALDALRTGRSHPQLTRHHLARRPGRIVFVLPGQGGQYPGMGRDLYGGNPVFADSVDACDAALQPHTGWSVRAVLCQDPAAPALDDVDVVQPVLFTMMVSLAAVLADYGIVPDAVIGHSQGEIAAAYVAGVLSLPEAARVVALRSQALRGLSGAGAMASVLMCADELLPRLGPWHESLSIAATNGPSHTIISGDAAALEQFSAAASADGLHIRPIAVDYASHSAQVQPLREGLLAELAELTPKPAVVPLYSTVGQQISDEPLDTTTMGADYWYRNLREPVGFHDGVVALLATDDCTFVELSPHPVLAPAITDTLALAAGRSGSTVITTLHRDRPDQDAVASTLARLHSHGHSPSWSALYPDARTVALPTYPFQHRAYWTTGFVAPAPVAAVDRSSDGVLWNAIDEEAVDTVARVLGLSNAANDATLGAVVRALRQRRNDLGVRSAANALRHQIGWRPVTPITFPRTRLRLLVLALPEQAEDAWITALTARDAEAVEVLTVDPDELDRDSLHAALTAAVEQTDCDAIVSFLALAERAHPDIPAISAGLYLTLVLAQAHCASDTGIPLWLVTQGAVTVAAGDTPPSPVQSAVWGLGQSVCLEHPDRWGGLIDLPRVVTPRAVENLGALLTCPQTEDQLALRTHGVSGRRLLRAALTPERLERPRTWKPSGPAVVTGASGRLGRHVIRWLAEAGAGPIVLLSRHAAEHPGLAELQHELQQRGVVTSAISVDVCDRPALAAVLADIRATHGRIQTVVHAAAAIGWNAVSDTTPEEFRDIYAAKAGGADNLVELLEHEPPDTFILFSSAAATWGGALQGAYAAANAHLDALAVRLRGTGCAAVSAAFGLWTDETSTMPQEVLDYLQRIGVNEIPPDTALTALEQAIEAGDTLITIADVSWDRFLPLYTARRAHPLLTEFVPPAAAGSGTGGSPTSTASASRLRNELAGQSPERRLQTLAAMVAGITASVLAQPDPEAVDPDVPFVDLGIDSLTALELRNTLNEHTGLLLPATLVLDQPTPSALANHLAELLIDTGEHAAEATRISPRADGRSDNLLAYLDQTAFLGLRALHGTLIQVTWIYDRAVDMDGLRRFHRNLGQGLLGRRIERSPIPFARDRWVLAPDSREIDVAPTPRARADVSAWAAERARVAIDPEWGPGWHLGVLPIEGGGAAVSLVASHAIVDAIAFAQAVTEAAEGRTRDLGYPPARSRTRRVALNEDLRQTVRELPGVGRALRAVVRRARNEREEFKSSIKAPPSALSVGGDQVVEMPALYAYIDAAEWDSLAKKLGASSNSLVAGIACRLAARIGRVHDDGTVTLRFVVSLRTGDDMRGNALTSVDVTVDPTGAATDLSAMQGEITQAILEAVENSDDELLAPLPLAAMTPNWLARKLAGVALGGGVLPVTCSNLGELPPAANRPDGSDADYVYMRRVEPIKLSTLERIGGELLVVSGRGRGKVFVEVSAFRLGHSNTKDELREVVSSTLAEFGLTAEID